VVTVTGYTQEAQSLAGRPAEATRPAVLALWGPPRSVSTAFFRMMAQRGDFQLYHEPFSDLAALRGYRLGQRIVTDSRQLLDEILRRSATVPVFFKDTTELRHTELFADRRVLEEVTHTFVIRDPRRAIESYYAINPQVTLEGIGYEHLYEIFEMAREATGRVPVVLDADVLVRRPKETVHAYCDAVGIPFDERALTWDPIERSEWSRANRWHVDVSHGSAFLQGERTYKVRVDNSETLADYYKYHLPFYEKLRAYSLAVPATATF
jgi:hypothetical protein